MLRRTNNVRLASVPSSWPSHLLRRSGAACLRSPIKKAGRDGPALARQVQASEAERYACKNLLRVVAAVEILVAVLDARRRARCQRILDAAAVDCAIRPAFIRDAIGR